MTFVSCSFHIGINFWTTFQISDLHSQLELVLSFIKEESLRKSLMFSLFLLCFLVSYLCQRWEVVTLESVELQHSLVPLSACKSSSEQSGFHVSVAVSLAHSALKIKSYPFPSDILCRVQVQPLTGLLKIIIYYLSRHKQNYFTLRSQGFELGVQLISN